MLDLSQNEALIFLHFNACGKGSWWFIRQGLPMTLHLISGGLIVWVAATTSFHVQVIGVAQAAGGKDADLRRPGYSPAVKTNEGDHLHRLAWGLETESLRRPQVPSNMQIYILRSFAFSCLFIHGFSWLFAFRPLDQRITDRGPGPDRICVWPLAFQSSGIDKRSTGWAADSAHNNLRLIQIDAKNLMQQASYK